MPKMYSKLSQIIRQNATRFERMMFLKQLYEAENYEIRIAGGAVRDVLLGKEPHDIDFATNARPEDSLRILQPHSDVLRIFVTPSGQKHGTVAAKFKLGIDPKTNAILYDEEEPFEITTLRIDKKTTGRFAEVEFIRDWKLDAERRDLTINSMFLTLDGNLIDYFNGEEDLKTGTVRFVGNPDNRMKEDYLRILRFFRFWSRYGKQRPDIDTLDSIKRNLDGLKGISGERIWQETKKILGHLPFTEVVKLILELNVIKYMGIDEIDSKLSADMLQDFGRVEKNIESFKNQKVIKISKKLEEALPVIAFSCLILTSTTLENAHLRLKFSNFERFLLLHILINRNEEVDVKKLKYLLAVEKEPDVPALRERIKAFLIYKGADLKLLEEIESWIVPSFPVRGDQVKKVLSGMSINPRHSGKVLGYMRDEWAKSDYKLGTEELAKLAKTNLDLLIK